MLKPCLNCGVEFEGAPQAKFHSDACRKAYARQEVGQTEVVEEGELGQELAQSRTRTASISEDEYVRQALARSDLFDRVRAERYARWRYRGFHNGEIASL